MLDFLKKVLIMSCFSLFLIVIALVVIDSIGWSDSEYKRFTSKGEASLILGTSRSAQGIVPEVINNYFKGADFALPVYNFSFNVGESPYGEIYYRSIKRKLAANAGHNSLFIIAVDPFCLAVEESQDKNHYREKGRKLDVIKHYYRPQIYYLLRFCHPWKWKKNGRAILHNDGWLDIKGVNMDSISVSEGIRLKMKDYNSYTIHPSQYRINWLKETISLLKDNGHVFLCRIPVSKEMGEWEDKNWPLFDKDMESIAAEFDVPYFDFTILNGELRTTDGNHLYYQDSKVFTGMLCDSIKAYFFTGK